MDQSAYIYIQDFVIHLGHPPHAKWLAPTGSWRVPYSADGLEM